MKIINFLPSLLPLTNKTTVTEDIRILREELHAETLPAYKNAVEAFKRTPFVADFTKQFDQIARKRVDNYKDNYIATIDLALNRALKNLDTISKLVDEQFNEDILRDAMTYTRTNLLQYIEMVSFICSYSRRLLLLTYSTEADPKGIVSVTPSATRDINWLLQNQDVFLLALNAASLKPKELDEKFESIPDMTATIDGDASAQAVVGSARLDPFGFRLIPYKLNPIYHIKMAITSWQVSRHKLSKEEKTTLELRLLHLKMSRDGTKDARLERNIEYNEERIADLRYKINKLETQYE